MSSTVVAIDGPAGAGKSSVAKALAARMNFVHINTGSLYRAIAYALLQMNVAPENITPEDLEHISLAFDGARLLLNGVDPGENLRAPECAAGASAVAKIPFVREFLLPVQRSSADGQWIVMEGRDIGTVIFPDAKVKIFLTASAAVRAGRRLAQGECAPGATLESIQKEIEARDLQDSTRATAPLKAADDAVVVDCSDLSLEETVDAIAAVIKQKNC
ncbi:MAG: (d)CMP kinase [Lentisphaeria bacterium]|nr:(d)CMP kinase [Lentisphaeria bacterium]